MELDINDIRRMKEIEEIWKNVQAKGRCWGRNGNKLDGSQINLFDGDEEVIIIQDKKPENSPSIMVW